MKPYLTSANFVELKTKEWLDVQTIIFPGDLNKTIIEFVRRCRLLKTENDCYCRVTFSNNISLVWDSTNIKEKIYYQKDDGTVIGEFRLSSDETQLTEIK